MHGHASGFSIRKYARQTNETASQDLSTRGMWNCLPCFNWGDVDDVGANDAIIKHNSPSPTIELEALEVARINWA
jgi:hypothetical protein